MSQSKKRRSGKKNLGSTRNQRRKAEYAAKAGEEWRRRSGPSASRARLVGTRGAHVDCGNPACRKCFVHVAGVGIYRPGDSRMLSERRQAA